jgi:apolipoprotein D and lipocalin family protein
VRRETRDERRETRDERRETREGDALVKRLLGSKLILLCSGMLAGCIDVPDGIEPVEGFEVDSYLGEWYEIARLDHSFEENLQAVTARYSRRDDGGLEVVNRGFNVVTGEWEEANGKVFFVREADIGYLRVSFFGPFYGAYVIFELGNLPQTGSDYDYDYAFVTGNSRGYLWLLARSPEIGARVREQFIERSKALGFNTERVIFVCHEAPLSDPAP